MKTRVKISVKGIVQGVGFRPFIYRLAHRHHLNGWVLNCPRGVQIEVEGDQKQIEEFASDMREEAPPLAKITYFDLQTLPLKGFKSFEIKKSVSDSTRSVLISPDIGICSDCLRELFDPSDRRYLYPFINCTNCGPRYTIIEDIPYDRVKTTMRKFKMCPPCQREYEDPLNRRFHAQPNACWDCGPQLALLSSAGEVIEGGDPVQKTIEFLKAGKIVAIKGLGGFHLAVDAENEEAVKRLRRRKMREEKALAIMSLDIDTIKRYCHVTPQEESILQTQKRPIVLLEKRENITIADSVAPQNRFLGVMLPYTPLHYLILKNDFLALVMTSGNLTDEPIAIDNTEAVERLKDITDYFLMNDRDIFLRSDDSVIRILQDKEMVIRRSRGYVPVPIIMRDNLFEIMAVGAELKNTVCLSKGNTAFLSQHIGDLENNETLSFFEKTIEHLKRILEIEPKYLAYDLHPEYLSTKYALEQDDLELIGVQHHHAHLVSCMAEHELKEKAIGVSFDGVGYGTDGKIWGGEFLISEYHSFVRKGHFKYIPMPGGAAAIKEPYRMAISYLYRIYGDGLMDQNIDLLNRVPEKYFSIIIKMINNNINSPLTSSCGRLFDSVSALLDVRDRINYEGQAAIELELLTIKEGVNDTYSYRIFKENDLYLIDPSPIIEEIIEDKRSGISRNIISTKFHNTIVKIIVDMCGRLREETGLTNVVLSGGVFQNYFLLNRTVEKLKDEKFKVFTHSLVPPNDGGIALGQLIVANEKIKRGICSVTAHRGY